MLDVPFEDGLLQRIELHSQFHDSGVFRAHHVFGEVRRKQVVCSLGHQSHVCGVAGFLGSWGCWNNAKFFRVEALTLVLWGLGEGTGFGAIGQYFRLLEGVILVILLVTVLVSLHGYSFLNLSWFRSSLCWSKEFILVGMRLQNIWVKLKRSLRWKLETGLCVLHSLRV